MASTSSFSLLQFHHFSSSIEASKRLQRVRDGRDDLTVKIFVHINISNCGETSRLTQQTLKHWKIVIYWNKMRHRSDAMRCTGQFEVEEKKMTINVTSTRTNGLAGNYFIYCTSSWRFASKSNRILTRKCPRKPRDEKMKKDKTRSEREIIYKIDMLHHVPWILM